MKINIGIIGGSGIYSLEKLKLIKRVKPKTKYGDPSDFVEIYEFSKGRYLAFLPRHGKKHLIPPHKIPYKANLAALKSLGVRFVISTAVVGSLKSTIHPGDVVIPNQFIDLTWGRDDYFDYDKKIIHLPMAYPYCESLRKLIYSLSKKNKFIVHKNGTIVVIQGPRFATRAESAWFIKQGWDIINMTQYPENYFARELGLCYASICTVTDYDSNIKKQINISTEEMGNVLKVFHKNIEKTKKLLIDIVLNYNFEELRCNCNMSILGDLYHR